MANIPNGTYPITLGNSQNGWASGPLVVGTDGSGNTTVTYKTVTVTSYNLLTTNVSWTVTVQHAQNNCTLVFTSGNYTQGPPEKITNGTVTGACLVSTSGDPEDTWSSTVTGATEKYGKAGV